MNHTLTFIFLAPTCFSVNDHPWGDYSDGGTEMFKVLH